MADEFAGYEYDERKRQKARRERIATAMLASAYHAGNGCLVFKDVAAADAIELADALIAALDKESPK